jgi:hypothetical protein
MVNNIFRRVFDGSSSSVVDITNNTITIPNHFFVTGEEVVYSALNGSESNWNCNHNNTWNWFHYKLPSSLYVVKVND